MKRYGATSWTTICLTDEGDYLTGMPALNLIDPRSGFLQRLGLLFAIPLPQQTEISFGDSVQFQRSSESGTHRRIACFTAWYPGRQLPNRPAKAMASR